MQLPGVARPISQFLWASMISARASGTLVPSCRYGTPKHRQLVQGSGLLTPSKELPQFGRMSLPGTFPREIRAGRVGLISGASLASSLSSDALQLLGTGVYSWRAQAQGSCPGVVISKVPQLVRNCPGAGQRASSVSGQQDTILRSGQVATGQLKPA